MLMLIASRVVIDGKSMDLTYERGNSDGKMESDIHDRILRRAGRRVIREKSFPPRLLVCF